MNVFEIGLTIACLILATSLVWTDKYFKDKIKELEDKNKRLDMINDMNGAKLERLENDIYALMDKFKKLESNYNSIWIERDSQK